MRTFLRIEFLYRQMLYNSETESRWATRATISTLLEELGGVWDRDWGYWVV